MGHRRAKRCSIHPQSDCWIPRAERIPQSRAISNLPAYPLRSHLPVQGQLPFLVSLQPSLITNAFRNLQALAVGVVEHGQSKVLGLLDQAIAALHDSAVDRQHIARGFAALLRRLQAQCKPTLLSRAGVRPGPDEAHEGPVPVPSAHPSPQRQLAHPETQLHHPPPADPLAAVTLPTLPRSAENHAGPLPLPPPLDHSHNPPAHASQSAFNWFPLDPVTAPNGLDIRTEFPEEFDWDPAAAALAVGKEQDLLFQSLWGGAGASGFGGDQLNPALNLFGTLVGDEFGLDY